MLVDYVKFTVTDLTIDRYFQKWVFEEDEEANAFWQEFMKKHPEKIGEVMEAKNLVLLLKIKSKDANLSDKQEVWQKILNDTMLNEPGLQNDSRLLENNLHKIKSDVAVDNKSYKSKIGFSGWSKIAASFFLFASLTLYYFIMKDQQSNNAEATAATEWVEKVNPWGQKSTLFLKDGSEVILNSGSQLSYSRDFDSDKREIHLSGEAYFKVAKDSNRPFVVISHGVETLVTGTEFNVKAFINEPIEVALIEGEVIINSPTQQLRLKPGEGCSYSHTNNQINKFVFHPKKHVAWKDGILYFHEAKEAEVLKQLEQWYGVKINIDNNSKKEWAYTGEFQKQSLHEVLLSIGYAMNFNHSINEDTITIKYE
jgi:transmembrane sensor